MVYLPYTQHMRTRLHVRTATNDDHEALSHTAIEINVMHAKALPGRIQVTADPLPTDYFHALIEADDATILVADRDGDTLGYAILKIVESPPIPMIVPRRYVFLNDLVVSQAEQRQGIGRHLIDSSVDWARAQGASEIELGVFEFNGYAIAFYEHLGFRTIKRTVSIPVGEV